MKLGIILLELSLYKFITQAVLNCTNTSEMSFGIDVYVYSEWSVGTAVW